MNVVINTLITDYKNGMGTVKLTKLADVYMVAFQPRYGEAIVNSFEKRSDAEIDFSHYVNQLQ